MLKHGTNKEVISLNNNQIKIESSALMGKENMFLIDTGADLNIIKLSAIKNNVPVEATSTTLIGINENSIKTLGIIKINLIIDKNNYFDTVFHVVDDKFPGSMTGILGIPFFSDNDVTLNLRKGEMIIDRQQNKENMISLPPRSNNVLTISVANENINNGDSVVINKQNLSKSIWLGNTISLCENNAIMANVINISENCVSLQEFKMNKIDWDLYTDTEVIETDLIGENSNDKAIMYFETDSNSRSELIKFSDRVKIISEQLVTDHLNEEELKALSDLCYEFSDVFFVEGDKIIGTNLVTHKIKTPLNHPPINTRQYRLAEQQKKEINRQVAILEQQQVIVKSNSPWNHPLILVPKKVGIDGEKKYRLCVDFRKLNLITEGNSWPLPLITDILDKLGHAKYFSTLDFANGYHQIAIHPGDTHKTAFSTSTGHWEWLKMPFGLKTAPAVFSELMHALLTGCEDLNMYAYLDDIVISAESLSSMIKKLQFIFVKLRENNLKLQPRKCHFLRKEVVFLGHKLSAEGVQPDEGKVECVKKVPIPKNTTDIKAFLGLTGYYRRFIKEYAKIAKPLTLLLKKNTKFAWGVAQQYAFEKLKDILTTEPILQYPDFDKEFLLASDASNYAVGCVLSQGEMGNDKPIAYASRVLNTSEVNYSTIEKECLGIVFGIKHFRPYLWGKRFKIITDHRPLVWLFNVSDMNSRLARWRILLQEFDYEIVYKPGTEHSNADALSRICVIGKLDKMSFEEFMSNNKVYINNNIEEINETYDDIPNDYDILFTITADVQLKFNVLREYINQLGHIGSQVFRNTKVKEVAVVRDSGRKYLYAFTEESFNQSPTYQILYETLINVKNVCVKEKITVLAIPKIMSDLNYDIVRSMLRYIFKGTDIKVKIYTDYKISDEVKKSLIEEQHITCIGGHQGVSRTVKRLRQWVLWKNMKREVKNYINNCKQCQINKEKRKSKQPLVITTTSSRAFERVALDIVGPLTKSRNDYMYILTLQDDLTKFSAAYPLKTTDAATIAKTFVEKFVCYFGIPTNILSDQGSNFLSSLFKQM